MNGLILGIFYDFSLIRSEMGEDSTDAERMQEHEYELQYYEFNSTTFIADCLLIIF